MNFFITPHIAELIGMHVGDGTLYKTNRSLVWEMRGGLDEKEYYNQHVAKIMLSIFGIEFRPKFRSGGKQGCFGIQTSKKEVSQKFLDLGFLPGPKSHTVKVPKYILEDCDEIKQAFVRGYFDTDGCIRFERINNQKRHTYPKIEFGSVSKALRDGVFLSLIELVFRPCKWGKKEFKICLSGVSNVEKFIKEISPKNTKHLNKYHLWRKQGFYSPNSTNATVAYSKPPASVATSPFNN